MASQTKTEHPRDNPESRVMAPPLYATKRESRTFFFVVVEIYPCTLIVILILISLLMRN